MFNVYGRKLPDPNQIARNLAQLREEDRRRVHRLALRGVYEPTTCLFPLGTSSHRRWWVSPVCVTTLLLIGFLAKDWSRHALDMMLTQMGFY